PGDVGELVAEEQRIDVLPLPIADGDAAEEACLVAILERVGPVVRDGLVGIGVLPWSPRRVGDPGLVVVLERHRATVGVGDARGMARLRVREPALAHPLLAELVAEGDLVVPSIPLAHEVPRRRVALLPVGDGARAVPVAPADTPLDGVTPHTPT